ncbi:putative dolichyl pyrophosphate Glc1Man9GlcNAc2 alpha-1,3-glucosyltransferase [Trichinella patagoniensis]|uniref:Alpha-1,3-glucosyltransferase n=1 Tax=Trichinella patagoniensis TaxID=990121 RepID=A0A0V0Z884_9BILA|nr:putative dolichyl pyrophosphate Glc1Man9GlcNAc2 alpha-1,3-glucosyltransferase [Trichinella patagoniensis]
MTVCYSNALLHSAMEWHEPSLSSYVVALFALKTLCIYAYYSTDFEVHRNWLAVTYSLPFKHWYYENTSQWTLDYPPGFAWFEYLLSQFARQIDPKMVEISAEPYTSLATVLFQRFTLSAVVLGISSVSLGPFVYAGQMKQLITRLFPFGRGLTHAYWAPNFWALYNFCDFTLLGTRSYSRNATPDFTAYFIFGCNTKYASILYFFALPAFLFGWHVHEKAVLTVIIPLTMLAVRDGRYAKLPVNGVINIEERFIPYKSEFEYVPCLHLQINYF